MINEELINRKNRLLSKIDDNSLVVLFSGVSKKRSADSDFRFVVNRNFYYFSNIEQENSAILIYKHGAELKEILFIDEKDPHKEAWTGIRLSDKQASNLSGIKDVRKIATVYDVIDEYLTKTNKLYLDLEKELKIAPSCTTNELKAKLLSEHQGLEINDVYETIIKLRMVKSDYEIKQLEKAIKITDRALTSLMKGTKAGLYEYNLVNKFKYLVSEEKSYLSFPTICASGKNGVILHYPNAKDKLKDNELVLCDLGATYNHYCADISRTFPINGKYNKLQKQIYSLVLKCNKEIIKSVKPGIRILDLQEKTKEILAEGAIKLGIIKSKEELINIYFHGVSHHLGLDTHDPDYSNRQSLLEEGNVITVEPGLYIKKLNIGIRIEDDVLVTKTGSRCLSKCIKKEIKDIENIMHK